MPACFSSEPVMTSMGPVTQDRRSKPRHQAEGTASHLRVDEEICALGLSVVDLSETGAFVQTDAPLPIGTAVELELVRRGMAGVRLTGHVVHSAPERGGMAVQFGAMPPSTTRRLEEVLRALAAGSGAGGDEELLGQVRLLLGDLDETLRALGDVNGEIARLEQEIAALRVEDREVSEALAQQRLVRVGR